ncbi:putative membrane protein [Ehrlichia japonica]|uniref:Putative membrane protein n=1 Tax=Ehrlichia japonica TaxID=391036 RepID=X5H048_9RICK|nr:putative membrane protein [Ehrlichia japonica]
MVICFCLINICVPTFWIKDILSLQLLVNVKNSYHTISIYFITIENIAHLWLFISA